jgi:ribosomal protein S1
MPQDPRPSHGLPLDADLEREIQEALGETSLLGVGAKRKASPAPRTPRPSEEPGSANTKTGTVVGVGKDDVFLEFGPKEQGVLPLAQFAETPDIGTQVKVRIESFDAKENLYLCALSRSFQRDADWASIEVGAVVMGTVRAVNKGGVELQVGRVLTAFLPASHVALERVEDLESLIGQALPVEVVEVDPERRRIVVSRRGILGRERSEKRASVVRALQPGAIVQGTVTRVEPFGAFVDVGGVDGLLHVSQMAWKRVEKPEEVVKVGDVVKVQVLEISEDGNRIGLGMKQLVEDPWLAFTRQNLPGKVLQGKVTRLAQYGAFVEVAEGVEGLAHVSQLSPNPVRHAKEIVKEGQAVTVRIVSVDAAQHRIGLSLLTERGDRITDDVADDATIREVVERTRQVSEPTLGDLLRQAMEAKAAPKKKR